MGDLNGRWVRPPQANPVHCSTMEHKPAPKRKRYPKGSGPHPMGRPSVYAPALWAELIERLSAGEPLQQICRDEHMPSPSAVYAWTEPDRRPDGIPTTLQEDFARARRIGHDAIAASTLDIADDARNDWMERNAGDSPGWIANGEHIQRSKLRIETRLKLLAKWDRRYSDKLELEHAGRVAVASEMTDAEAAARMAFLLARGMADPKAADE